MYPVGGQETVDVPIWRGRETRWALDGEGKSSGSGGGGAEVRSMER